MSNTSNLMGARVPVEGKAQLGDLVVYFDMANQNCNPHRVVRRGFHQLPVVENDTTVWVDTHRPEYQLEDVKTGEFSTSNLTGNWFRILN